MLYLNDKGLLDQARLVALALQAWLDDKALAVNPVAHVAVSSYWLNVLIGDIIVWTSEENLEDPLTRDFCLARYEEEVRHIAAAFASWPDTTGNPAE